MQNFHFINAKFSTNWGVTMSKICIEEKFPLTEMLTFKIMSHCGQSLCMRCEEALSVHEYGQICVSQHYELRFYICK